MSLTGFEFAVLAVYCKFCTQVFSLAHSAIKAKGTSLPT